MLWLKKGGLTRGRLSFDALGGVLKIKGFGKIKYYPKCHPERSEGTPFVQSNQLGISQIARAKGDPSLRRGDKTGKRKTLKPLHF